MKTKRIAPTLTDHLFELRVPIARWLTRTRNFAVGETEDGRLFFYEPGTFYDIFTEYRNFDHMASAGRWESKESYEPPIEALEAVAKALGVKRIRGPEGKLIDVALFFQRVREAEKALMDRGVTR